MIFSVIPSSLSGRMLASTALRIGSVSRLGLHDGSFTIELWLRGCELDAGCEYAVLGNHSSGELLHFMVRGLRAGLRIHRREHVGRIALRNGAWHHLAYSYDKDAQKMSVFIDGVLDLVIAMPPFMGSGAVTLGSYRGVSEQGRQRPFRGNLDEVRFFTRARSQHELRADRERHLGGAEPDLAAVYRLDGRADQALAFCGTRAAAGIELPPLHLDFSQGLTIEAWVRYKTLKPWARILDLGNGPSSNNIVLASGASGDELSLLIYLGGSARQLLAPSALCEGAWMHCAATVDSDGNGQLYKNGMLLASGALALPANVPRSSNFIGKSNWSGDASFEGALSEVRLWNRARGQEELRRDQYRRLCGSEKGLCGNWRLDEECGELAHDHGLGGYAGRRSAGTEPRALGLLLAEAMPAASSANPTELTKGAKDRMPPTRSVLYPRPPRAGSNRRSR